MYCGMQVYLSHTHNELDFMKFSNINKHLNGVQDNKIIFK